MPVLMYDASVPVFKQILGSLTSIIEKAEVYANERKMDPNALLQARLFPDMFTFTRQVLLTTDFAKGAAARLSGIEVPKYEDNEQTFEEVKARIAKTLAFIATVKPEQMEGSDSRDVTVPMGPNNAKTFKGQTYLFHYALPNFHFHAATAYAILRHNGLDIGKKDFIGKF